MSPSPALPPAVSGERIEFDSPAGRLSCYTACPDVTAPVTGAPPLLLVHSVNAAGSAYEVRPLYEHYRARRVVFAPDLPGFGFSDRSERRYTPRLMTDAVLAMAREIRRLHGEAPVDALALSLGSEFLARAAAEAPELFRTLALVSPTGFNGTRPRVGPPGSDRGMGWLYRAFTFPPWSRGFYNLLTRPGSIRFFLEKTWGTKAIDEGLWAYDCITTRQPGARHAPFWFVSGYLFSGDIARVYDALRHPVWMSHGVRGDFTDYRQKARYEGRPNWSFREFPTGALPYFELPDEFVAAYDAFLAAAQAGGFTASMSAETT
ncbi:MAG: alpha/beta fold hydrolase [Pseudomonadota bacterium]